MEKQELVFGVFNKGQLLFCIGKPTFCTYGQAKVVCRLLKKSLAAVLQPGDYFAYDHAKKWNANT